MKRQKRLMHVNPHAILVGYSGKIGWDDRLLPLRMTGKQKQILKQQESDRNEKILQRSRFIQKYQNLSSIINNLNKENKNNENSGLLLELQGEKTRCKKCLLSLELKLDQLPDIFDESPQETFSRNKVKYSSKKYKLPKRKKSAFQKTYAKECVQTHGQNYKQSSSDNALPKKKPSESFGILRKSTSSCMFGSVKSQILVRDHFSNLHTIRIDLFSNGENLLQVLATEFGEDMESYNVTFGTKKVEKQKSLYEQRIYHGSTINLCLKLRGGTKSKKKKQRKESKSSANKDNPESWTKVQVKAWFDNICKDLEIDEEKVSPFTSMNGKGMNMLQKEDWLSQLPVAGALLFNMWNNLKKQQPNEQNSRTDTKKEEKSGHVDHTDEKTPTFVAASEEKASVCKESHNICEDVNVCMTRGPFGKVGNLRDMEDSVSLYDFVTSGDLATPKPGTIISVSGICRQKPECVETVVTFLLRDDPPGAVSVFNQVKIDVRSKIENQDLNPGTVEEILKKIRSDTPVAVRGRVEKLDDGYVSSDEQACETLGFKLVVDEDHHGLVYEEKSTFTRQLSQPETTVSTFSDLGIYPCVVDDTSLDVGDTIEKTTERIFCNSTVSDGEIKQIAVAFKNSSGGDIFVGIEGNGKVTGMEFTQGEALKWREKKSKIIAQILPESNEQLSMCATEEEARDNIGKKSFVSVMRLGDSTVRDSETVRVIARIHITKGTARVYFSKQSDVHAYVRVGAETKRINDYLDLFSRLDSLRSRTIQSHNSADEDSYIEQQCKEAIEKMTGQHKYNVFKELKFESQEREFKMIFGDKPVEIIENRYLAHYTCGFLNSLGGTILFGVQEDEQSKLGHVVGIVIPPKEREELIRKSVNVFNKFYPPVSSSQFCITFYDVIVHPKLIVKYPETSAADNSGKCVLLRGPPDEIGSKWPKFMKDKLQGTHCRVIRVKSECFCIVLEKPNLDIGEQLSNCQLFAENNPRVKLEYMEDSELENVLKNVCVVELQVYRSQFPIHMIKAIETFVIDEHVGELCPLSQDKLMYRFGLDSRWDSSFEVEKFLNHVDNFELAGNSYILVASPFDFPKAERDLYGLVIPHWTLTIDFDQDLKQEGHLYQIFEDLNDLHQTERNRFVCTHQDHKLDLNPEHGVCWLAARGYKEIDSSLSKEGHGNWNMTHRKPLSSLLEAELTSCLKLNRLNIVVLWDEKHGTIIDSLRMILEEILSIHGDRTAVTFVCSTAEAKSDISDKLVEPLQKNYWQIIEQDRVYEAPPYVLAQYLSYKLPSPYRQEDDYQVPHKKYFRGTPKIVPEKLPQRLRQNIHGHLEIMYMTKQRKAVETELNKQRNKFYSGSEMTKLGLYGEIGIKRSKMAALEKEFKTLSNDKKSHVSLILIKADRGAGTTTMCLQFLFQHHKEYPCAQLTEIRHGLASYIENINKATKLPLVLLVDEEIAHLQDFLDLKKEVEARNINVIFLLIEAAEAFCRKPTSPRKPNKVNNPRIKSARDDSLYGTSPHKMVELRRELDDKEVEELTNELIAISEESKTMEDKLTKLKDSSRRQKSLRTFAHFSLTAFGSKFSGLRDYVKFRLGLADEQQKVVLAFLALTHVFTHYSFPTSALAGFLETKTVNLEVVFGNTYLRELLSPLVDENDSRRISFLEVADEILAQLATETPSGDNEDKYWSFIKHVSVQMAKVALCDNIGTKKIDRLSRKLFVTSEYESEKFSLLVRSMKEDNRDTARDTLLELVDVFQKHTSFRAHLLAHLAKYYMTVYGDFSKAKPLIEQAINDQEDDVLLHHIHGDIIRRHVAALKNKENVDLDAIVSCAIKSSDCFELVRNKRPHMSHGYVSDAMVRIIVMQAARKKMEGKDASFVDYLIQMIDNLKEGEKEISTNERYLLSVIPDAHQFLEDSVIDFEHKEIWKDNFINCIGELSNLKRLYEKLKDEKDSISGCSGWLPEVALETQVLYNALEIETKDLSPEELEKRIKGIEECGSHSKCGERTMRFWIRYSRLGKSVPPLEEINKRIKQWVIKAKRRGGISPHAEFYNYVVKVLIALKDPKDREKMSVAKKLIKQQQQKKYNKKEEVVLPLEWLHCKEGHHIESINSLLNHADLVKETSKSSRGRGKQKRPGREVIEGSLFEKQVTKWEGTVKVIKNDWHGTIVFKDHLEVHFVPLSVQPSMPATGETVRFCLTFDKHGLSAWTVVRAIECNQPKKLSEIVSSDEDSSSENDKDEEDTENKIMAAPSLFSLDIPDERREIWDDYNGQRMQGVVISTNSEKGFGKLKHPDVKDNLFFHASQLYHPVKSLEGNISKYMTLEFIVEKLSERTRAADIHVLQDEDVSPAVKEFLALLRKEQHSACSSSQRESKPSIHVESGETQYREQGIIVIWNKANAYGFIKSDNQSHGTTNIFFHRNNLVNKGTEIKTGDRVQFRVSETKKGLEANDIFVQSQYSSKKKWAHLIDRGIQEGFVTSITDKGGFITNQIVVGENLPFYYNDILNANNFSVVIGSKVHFEVNKRGGRCIAVKINVIGSPEPMIHQDIVIQPAFMPNVHPGFPYNQPLFFSSHHLGDQVDVELYEGINYDEEQL